MTGTGCDCIAIFIYHVKHEKKFTGAYLGRGGAKLGIQEVEANRGREIYLQQKSIEGGSAPPTLNTPLEGNPILAALLA